MQVFIRSYMLYADQRIKQYRSARYRRVSVRVCKDHNVCYVQHLHIVYLQQTFTVGLSVCLRWMCSVEQERHLLAKTRLVESTRWN